MFMNVEYKTEKLGLSLQNILNTKHQKFKIEIPEVMF
jgi:hypothetical protein